MSDPIRFPITESQWYSLRFDEIQFASEVIVLLLQHLPQYARMHTVISHGFLEFRLEGFWKREEQGRFWVWLSRLVGVLLVDHHPFHVFRHIFSGRSKNMSGNSIELTREEWLAADRYRFFVVSVIPATQRYYILNNREVGKSVVEVVYPPEGACFNATILARQDDPEGLVHFVLGPSLG